MAEVFVLGGGKPTPTEFRPGGPKTVNHQAPKSPQSHSKGSCWVPGRRVAYETAAIASISTFTSGLNSPAT